MPPLVQPRADNSGRNFTIVFAVVASTVVVVCIVFACYPKLRKKYPPNPTATRYNGLAPCLRIRSPAPTFPSHPVVMRTFGRSPRSRPSQEVERYDPRTTTPFPNTPPAGHSVSLTSIKPIPSSNSLRNKSTEDDVFTLPKASSSRRPAAREYQTPSTPRIPNKFAGHDTTLSHYGDAADYILALPEPLSLEPKSAGKAPSLQKQINRFPVPESISIDSDKLAHPKKLFKRLEELNETQKMTDGSHTNSLDMSSLPDGVDTQVGSPTMRKEQGIINQAMILGDGHTASMDRQAKTKDTKLSVNTHTKKPSWNPFSNKQITVVRSGTVTRPKTPVAEIRGFYDRNVGAKKEKSWNQTMAKNLTPSTEPLTATDSIDSAYHTRSTPPTPAPTYMSRLSLLPTPLRIRKNLQSPIDTPTRPGRDNDESLKSAPLPEVSDKLTPLQTVLRGGRHNRRSKGFFHAHPHEETDKKLKPTLKSRPAQLNLASSFRIQSPRVPTRRHSLDSASGGLLPPVLNSGHSRQSSSIYSRDTKGLSMARSPISPMFAEETTIEEEDMTKGRTLRQSHSLDLLNKINNWQVGTEDPRYPDHSYTQSKHAHGESQSSGLTLPVPHPSLVIDDLAGNPSFPDTFANGPNVPRIAIGRASDELIRNRNMEKDLDHDLWMHDTTRALKRVLDIEISSPEQERFRCELGKGKAPGGAEWI